jgi:hypothetical protein
MPIEAAPFCRGKILLNKEACTCTKNFVSVLYFYIIWNGQVICPLCWVLLQALCCWNGLAKCCTQHNAQGRDHSMTLRYGLVDSTIVKNSYYSIEILITIISV